METQHAKQVLKTRFYFRHFTCYSGTNTVLKVVRNSFQTFQSLIWFRYRMIVHVTKKHSLSFTASLFTKIQPAIINLSQLASFTGIQRLATIHYYYTKHTVTVVMYYSLFSGLFLLPLLSFSIFGSLSLRR